ncbi:hypothetical protein OF001_U140106 [Pseudomonas sp. OF001]|nr:hypothetical protein OF001_U140106 [Pseudomonas sp. OF001]
MPFTPSTVTVTSSPTIRVSPTRRVRISIPFLLLPVSGQLSARKMAKHRREKLPPAIAQVLTRAGGMKSSIPAKNDKRRGKPRLLLGRRHSP